MQFSPHGVAERRWGNRRMHMVGRNANTEGRIRAHPAAGASSGLAPIGLRTLGLDAARDCYLYMPPGYRSTRPAPLVLLLHGAGEDARDGLAPPRGPGDGPPRPPPRVLLRRGGGEGARDGLALLRGQADGSGLILLSLGSRGPTWDLIIGRGRYGPDVGASARGRQ